MSAPETGNGVPAGVTVPPAAERRPGWFPALDGHLKPSRLLGGLRATGIALWTVWMTCLNIRSALSGSGMTPATTMKWHRNVLRLAGIDVTVTGQPVRDRPVMVVANHASYLDIITLGALLPCSFVSKSEVRHWPVFGWMAVQQRTIFIERDPRKAAHHLGEMKARLEQGACLVLFPEGTSTDGGRVLPFKSSLFQAASIEFPETGEIEVQPVSIAYSRLDGMPMGRALRPYYTWYGDMDLAPHLIDWLGLGSLGIDVVFHEPVRLSESGGRKGLAARTQAACAQGVESALRGRPEAVETRAALSVDP